MPEFVLFGEDASRILISCDPENVERIKQIAVKYGLSAESHRQTVPDKLEIRVDGSTLPRQAFPNCGMLGRRAGTRPARGDRRAAGAGGAAEELVRESVGSATFPQDCHYERSEESAFVRSR